MRVSILELQERLILSEQELYDVLTHGRLDGTTLDPQVLAKARAAFLAAARRKATEH